MSDPHRPDDSASPWRNAGETEPSAIGYPPYPDPAYAGQVPVYPAGYPPQSPNPTSPLSQQHWGAGLPPGPPPSEPAGADGSPPEPPRSPSWLWFVASAAVLLVVGMVIALVISNGSAQRSATVAPPLTPVPPTPSTTAPRLTPATTTPPTTTPSTPTTTTQTTPSSPTTTPPSVTSTVAGVPQSVAYSVTGSGRALSIAYIGTGGVLSTEFNVVLPWSKQVTLTSQESKIASVTVVNFGEQVSCSVTVSGTQMSQHSGSLLTICAAGG